MTGEQQAPRINDEDVAVAVHFGDCQETSGPARDGHATFISGVSKHLDVVRMDVLNDSENWLIEDIRVNSTTVFVMPGAIPGDMFSSSAIDAFVKWPPLIPGSDIQIDVAYVGDDGPAYGEMRCPGHAFNAVITCAEPGPIELRAREAALAARIATSS